MSGGSAPKGYLLRFQQVYDVVGISQVEAYETIEKSIILVCKRHKTFNDQLYGCENVEENNVLVL